MMAKVVSKCLFLFLLSILIVCSSGTLVGFFYDARENNAIPPPTGTISFLKLNKVSPSHIRVLVGDPRVLHSLTNSSVSVDLYLNKTQIEDLRDNKPSVISWVRVHLSPILAHVKINSIIVTCSGHDLSAADELPMLLSALKSLHSVLNRLHMGREVKVSVAFSLPFLENLAQHRDLKRIFDFIFEARSPVIIEANIEGELSMGDQFVESVINTALSATAALLHHSDVSVVLTIKNSAVPSAGEVAQFSDKILISVQNSSQIERKITGLFAEVSPMKEFEQKELRREEEQIFHASHRELLDNFHFKAIEHDSFPSTPITNPVTTPAPGLQTNPTIVTVPATNPGMATPNPASTPLTVPSTTPTPGNSPVPITNPATTPGANPGQPVTNPVTAFPPPAAGVPVTNPATNPPGTTNSPTVPGQSWCVAKSGALETAIQAALDYACGIADCSAIQQGGSCYNPNTLQNHASYAFNSYYQKNPTQTSCDFGGTAMITNVNPSTGSCIYPSSASPSSTPTSTSPAPPTTSNPTPTPTPTTASPTPPTTAPPTPATASPTPTTATPTPATGSSSGAAVPSSISGSPPTLLNATNPASDGSTTVISDGPPAANSSTSRSTSVQPFICCLILIASVITGKLVLDM